MMKPYFAMGLFALYVVVVSLLRIMGEQEFPRVAAMKKTWGRTRGLALHFLANVALPLVLGVVFLSLGVAVFDSERFRTLAPIHHQFALVHLHVPPVIEPVFPTLEESIRNGEMPILLAAVSLTPRNQVHRIKGHAWEFSHEEVHIR